MDRKINMARTKRAKQLHTEVCRTIIVHLSKTGMKQGFIANVLYSHSSAVSRVLKRYNRNENITIIEKEEESWTYPLKFFNYSKYVRWKFSLIHSTLLLLRSLNFCCKFVSIYSKLNIQSYKAVEKTFLKVR